MLQRTVASRAALLCALALVSATMAPSTAAPLRARAVTFEGAEGAWLIRRGQDVFLYYVFAFRSQKASKPSHTRLFADRSRCRLHRVRGKLVASCVLEGRLEEIADRRFEMSPGSERAELNAGNHHVVWRGRGVPSVEVDPWIEPQAVLADAYLERRAPAGGKVFGRRVERRSLERGRLFFGVDVGVLLKLDDGIRKLSTTVRVTL